ncbi:MAG: hypothetical protein AAB250_05125, partial [Bdellovibrionota bacterium]
MRKHFLKCAGAVFFVALVLSFQNCTPTNFEGVTDRFSSSMESGNGEPYEGKLTSYSHFETTSRCSSLDSSGQPLPNDQILVYEKSGTKKAQLVREVCRDLKVASDISLSSIQIAADGSTDIRYAGKIFKERVLTTDFDVIAQSCPTGYIPKPGVSRTNLFTTSTR